MAIVRTKKHTAWIAPLQISNLTQRVAAIKAIIDREGKSKEKYTSPFGSITETITQLTTINNLVEEKGPYQLDASGKPRVSKNFELIFIDELDDPVISQLFNSIKTQLDRILDSSHNTFKINSSNYVLVTSLKILCDEIFNKCHRKNKQELTMQFFTRFYSENSAPLEVKKIIPTTPVVSVDEIKLNLEIQRKLNEDKIALENKNKELAAQITVQIKAVEEQKVEVNTLRMKLETKSVPPKKTSWWKYVMATTSIILGVVAIATGIGALFGVSLLAVGLQAVGVAIGVTASGSALLLGGVIYTRLAVRHDYNSQIKFESSDCGINQIPVKNPEKQQLNVSQDSDWRVQTSPVSVAKFSMLKSRNNVAEDDIKLPLLLPTSPRRTRD